MARGDHIYVKRWHGLWDHHGIDCGDGTVIHYDRETWLDSPLISRTPMEKFLKGDDLSIRNYDAFEKSLDSLDGVVDAASLGFNRFMDKLRGLSAKDLDLSEDAVIARAESRLGEDRFQITFNNCEHFASWCKTGISNSEQITVIWRTALNNTAFLQYRVQGKLIDVFEFSLKNTLPRSRS